MPPRRKLSALPRLVAFTAALRDDVGLDAAAVALLEEIGRRGTVAEAARRVDLSYRQALIVLERLNRQFRTPLTHTAAGGTGGGGATLTELGRRVVEVFRDMERRADKAVAAAHGELRSLLAPEVRDLDLSARNILEGKVVSMESDGILSVVKFALRDGQVLTALVTSDSAADLRLRRGMNVKGLFKADKVILSKET